MKVWISRTLLMLSLAVPLGDVQSNPQKKGDPMQVKFIDFEDPKTGVDGDVHYLPFEGGNLVIGHSDSSNSGWATLTRTPKQGESLYLFPESDD